MLLEDGQELGQKYVGAIINKNTAKQFGIKCYTRNIVPRKVHNINPPFKRYYMAFMISSDLIRDYTPKISVDFYRH